MSAPICRNCKHARRGIFGYDDLATCKIVSRDVVTGERQFCDIERRFGDLCGPSGKQFQHKRPWWAFWRKK